jgi:hypothetical protein
MGVFINKGEHPEVFKTKGKINEPNQGFLKTDYVSELVKEQKEANSLLNQSIQELKNLYQQQENTHSSQWREIGNQLNELSESNLIHEKFESLVKEWLTNLNEKNRRLQALQENESLLKQQMIEQINIVSQSNQEIVDRMGKYESSNDQLALIINEQLDLQNQMSDQFSRQEDIQNEVLSRLDKQEALTEKILRQINHIRSILFERTNYLAGKIENGYKVTSTYVYKLMTGSDQSLTFSMINPKNSDNQKKPE